MDLTISSEISSKIGLSAIIFLVISLIICIIIIIWSLKVKKRQEEQLYQLQQNSLLEASTVYNESPVKWIKQTKKLQHAKMNHFISENNNNPLNIYLLESHQIVQRLMLDFCKQNHINLFCFKTMEEMANFYNQQSDKPDLELNYLPNLIVASDMNNGIQLLNIYRENTELQKAKFIIISQNPNPHHDTLGTIAKPIDKNKMYDLLQYWLVGVLKQQNL